MKFGSARYVRARFPYLRVPLASKAGQDTKGQGFQAGPQQSGNTLTLHVPLDVSAKNIERTFDEFLRHNVSTVDRENIINALIKARGDAVEGLGKGQPKSAGQAAGETASPGETPNKENLEVLLYRHMGTRSGSPGRRREAVVIQGDAMSFKPFSDGAPNVPSPIQAVSRADNKRLPKKAGTGAATSSVQHWEARYIHVTDSFQRELCAPSWIARRFFDHMMRTGNENADMRGTGHVRVTHDSNAWPRTWSLERIAQVAASALLANLESRKWEIDNKIFCARFEGLNVFVALRDGPTDKVLGACAKASKLTRPELKKLILAELEGSIIGAYVSRTTSARAKERAELGKAMNLLQQLSHRDAKSIAATARHHDVWSHLGAAKALSLIKARLPAPDQAVVTRLEQLLSVGGTRHPIHEKLLGEHALEALGKLDYPIETRMLGQRLKSLQAAVAKAEKSAPIAEPASTASVGTSVAAAAAKEAKPQDGKASK